MGRKVTTGVLFAMSLWVVVMALTGCSTTRDDIDVWAQSVNGEQKIMEAIADPELEMPVRAYGASKLISIRRYDLFAKVMRGLDDATKLHIVQQAAGDIGAMLKSSDLKVQAAAKDALYFFMSLDNDVVKEAAINAILNWYATDFERKFSEGRHSGFHVLKRIGPRAGDLLVKELEKDGKLQVKIMKIIGDINDPKLNAQVSSYMIERFEKEKPEFSKTLLQMLAEVRDDRLTEKMNAFIVDKKQPLEARLDIFNALTYNPSKLTIPAAVNIFIERKDSIDMRGIAIEIIKKVGDDSLLKYLYPFLRDEDVKWAAFATILKLGGASAIEKTFSTLDGRKTFWRGDYDVARRHLKELDKAAAEPLAKFLNDKDVPIVVLALIGLQYTADEAYAKEKIQPMFGDKRKIEHYISDKDYTVGELAKAVYTDIVGR